MLYFEDIKQKIKKIFKNTDKRYDLNLIFNDIYVYNKWGSGSGPGSSKDICENYINFLEVFFQKYNIKSIADVGCGDWQFSKFIDFKDICYVGYDVAEYVVKNNIEKYSKENIQFIHYDGDFDKIKTADLIICKDVLQHLPNKKIFEFIDILYKFKYALISNDINGYYSKFSNKNIEPGDYRPLDLTKKPFNISMEHVFDIKRMPQNPDIATFLWVNPNIK
ncbi:class I SAM-dependent methyltransferase [Campylobacter lari]|uniref:class I SAM-dependent methyltransferase n=1 Tax=Campylobacter lari TaxID=201 RepID=UPI001C7CED2B|nr:class I SAM-dependent methyltransferase [Campylobacter lari]MBX2683461.1 class I SAM-dependent methyltransferase [Campylobacter lari]